MSKGITALFDSGVYAAALIKKSKYWPKGVPVDAIDKYSSDKDFTYVDILEAITEYGTEVKAINMFCYKEPEYVMKIMDTCTTLKEFDGADTRREYKRWYGQSLVRKFKYRQSFGLQLLYRHQIDDHNNRGHAHISIERKWATKFWTDRNFACYLAMTEVNTALADGHFCKGGKLIPTLQFLRKSVHEMMENTIGVYTVDSGRPRSSTCTPAIVPYKIQKVKNHEGSYDKKAQ